MGHKKKHSYKVSSYDMPKGNSEIPPADKDFSLKNNNKKIKGLWED